MLSVTGLTRSYVPTRFNVLNPCLRSSRNTYPRFPTTPIYTLYLVHEDSSSLSNVFISTTHSYVYVAFSITTSFSTLYSGLCLLRNTKYIYSWHLVEV